LPWCWPREDQTTSSSHYYDAVIKKYISGADFLSRTTLPNPADENVRNYAEINKKLAEMFAAHNTRTLIIDNVVELDGLLIGIDICPDHRIGVLWKELKASHHGPW
jgi:hypothetical protein